jgi:hypothetical protein
LILYNLGAGLYYMLVDMGATKRTVNALTRRIAVGGADPAGGGGDRDRCDPAARGRALSLQTGQPDSAPLTPIKARAPHAT